MGALLALVLLIFVLPKIGFTALGVAARSIASCCQSCIGLVAKGSWFALLQSLAATRILTQPVVFIGVAVLGVFVYIMVHVLWLG